MAYEASVTYSREIIRKAIRQWWMRFIAWHGFLAIGASLLGFAALMFAGYRSWEVGVLGAAAAMLTTLAIALFFVYLRRSMSKFERMRSKCVRFTFTDDRFCMESDIGKSELSWESIEQVWQFSDLWLLYVSKTVFMILPTAEMDKATRSFIVEQVTRHGGRVK